MIIQNIPLFYGQSKYYTLYDLVYYSQWPELPLFRTNFHGSNRPLVKSAYPKNYLLISQPKLSYGYSKDPSQ